MMSDNSFISLLGIELVQSNEKNKVSGYLKLTEKHSQLYGNAHGGVLYALADTVAGYLIWKNSTDVDLVNTIEMKMNYIAPAPIGGFIKAVANVKHLGRTTGVCSIDVFYHQDDLQTPDTKLVATAIATFTRIKKDQ